MARLPEISIVIPALNEEESIPPLYQSLKSVLGRVGKSYEIIFVDDGSTDATLKELEKIHKKDSKLKIISFRRNFGQTAAMAAGFDYAKGKVIVTLDADLQNDPKDVPRLLKELDRGYDIVSGWRKDRKEPFLTRRIPSMVANLIISLISGVKLHDYGCTLKAYRADVVKSIKLYGDMHRFIPAVTSTIGVKVSEIAVDHHVRRFGEPKYGIERTLRVILDVMTIKFLLSYQTRPLQLFGRIGFFLTLTGGGVFTWLVYERFFLHHPLSTRPLFLISIFLILVGIQFITLGLLAEMLMRIYYESQGKTIYQIRKVIG